MGFFKKLKETVLKLNADVSDVANQEKAVKLRKSLIKWGTILAIIGGVGLFACFAGFTISGFNMVNSFSFRMPVGIIISFLLFVPFGVLLSIGAFLVRLGLSILIAGAGTKFIDKSLNNRCECGYTLKEEDVFCPKCGRPIQIKCSQCGAINDRKNRFCNNCGKELK